MARYYLERNDKAELGYSSTPLTVTGTGGDADRVLLRGSAENFTVGNTVEVVDLYGSVADYVFVRGSVTGSIDVYRGNALVATVQVNAVGTEVRFAEGSLTMAQDVETGALSVGGQEITAEKAAYAGDQIDEAHKSEAGGGSGPVPGRGENYELPADLGAANIIQSGTGDDTYTTTTANGLPKDAQIVDASATDNDVLTLNLTKANENGSIVNVENIVVNWGGYAGATFNAENISHVNGSTITVNSAQPVFGDATVSNLQNHAVVAGTNITGKVTVSGAQDGASVTMGGAAGLTVSGAAAATSAGKLTVNAEKDFTLNLTATTAAYAGDEDVISVNAAKDVTVKAGANVVAGTKIATDAASAGKVTLDLGEQDASAEKVDVSGLKVDAVALSLSGGSGALVADQQVIKYTEGSSKSGNFALKSDDPGATGTVIVELSGDVTNLDISGATGPDLSSMVIRTDKAVTLTSLTGDADDSFILSGAGDVTLANSLADKVSLVAADDYTGKLTVSKLDAGSVIAGQGGSTATTTGATLSTDVKYQGGTGVDAYVVSGSIIATTAGVTAAFEAGDGNDTAEIKGTVTVGKTTGSGGTLILNMGAGDDTVTFGSGDFTLVAEGKLSIDFGDGEKDTLVVAGDAKDVDLTSGSAIIKGMDVLDVSNVSTGSGGLTVNQSQIETYDFLLKGNGLTINLEAKGNLDLSGVTSADTATPSLKVDGDTVTASVTLSSALSETIDIHASTKASYLTLTNFRANAEDKLDVSGGATTATASGATSITVGESDSLDVKIDAAATAVKGAVGKWAYFVHEDATFVVAASTTSAQTVVKLMGTDYAANDLQASILVS